MAKISLINREQKRRAQVKKYAGKRAELFAVIRDGKASDEDKAAARAMFTETYRKTFSTPYVAGARRMVDDIIEPSHTRLTIARALESLVTKRELRPTKKHGLIPL